MDNKSYIVAIDLGSSSIAVAAGSREPDGKLNVLDVVTKPMDGMVAGEVMNIEQVTGGIREAVSELVGKLGIKVSEAYTGVSGVDIKCAENSYFVYVASKDGEILDEDVAKLHDSMDNLQPPQGVVILDRVPQKYLIDRREETQYPVGRFGRELGSTFNYILGNGNSLERMGKAFARLNIKQLKTYTNAQASAAAVLTDDEKELGAAVINIGAGCSDICIWQDKILRYVGVIPIGSAAINHDIRSIAVPERNIEKLKTTYGYAVPSRIPEDKKDQTIKIKGRTARETKEVSFYNLSQIIEARLLDIVEHAMEEIKDAGYQGKLGAGIVLTGGGSLMKGIDILFNDKTGYDVRIGGTEHSLVSKESYEYADDIRLSTVLGLLLMGLKDSDIKVDDDPANKRHKPVIEKEKEQDPDDYFIDDDEEEEVVKPKKPAKEEHRPEKEKPKEKEKKAAKPKKEKKSLKDRFGGIFTNMFEIVDDEEI